VRPPALSAERTEWFAARFAVFVHESYRALKVYRIKAGEIQCYLTRDSLESVMAVAERMAGSLPENGEVLVFRGRDLVGSIRVLLRD
jgi:hypothetical protein